MIEYTMQLAVQNKDGKFIHISFMDVQAENVQDARELAKERYEEAHPDLVVRIPEGVYIVKTKHIK